MRSCRPAASEPSPPSRWCSSPFPARAWRSRSAGPSPTGGGSRFSTWSATPWASLPKCSWSPLASAWSSNARRRSSKGSSPPAPRTWCGSGSALSAIAVPSPTPSVSPQSRSARGERLFKRRPPGAVGGKHGCSSGRCRRARRRRAGRRGRRRRRRGSAVRGGGRRRAAPAAAGRKEDARDDQSHDRAGHPESSEAIPPPRSPRVSFPAYGHVIGFTFAASVALRSRRHRVMRGRPGNLVAGEDLCGTETPAHLRR